MKDTNYYGIKNSKYSLATVNSKKKNKLRKKRCFAYVVIRTK